MNLGASRGGHRLKHCHSRFCFDPARRGLQPHRSGARNLTMNQSSMSGPIAFQVMAAGSFNQEVALPCAGLPAGAACNFQPSGPVSPGSGSPVPVTLTISTGATTPTGTYSITINATTAGGPTRTQTLSLTVQAGASNDPDFALGVSNPSLTVGPNEPAVFNGTLTAAGGYASVVNLSCAGSVPLMCTPAAAQLTPTLGGAAFTITASSDVQGTYSFNIVATGTDAAHITRSTAVQLIVGFNLAINNNSAAQTIAAGQTASYNLDAVPLGNGSIFPSNLTLSCASAGLPPLSTCSFTPKQVSSGSGNTNILLSIVTTAASPASGRLIGPDQLRYQFAFLVAGVVLAFGGLKKPVRRKKQAMLAIILGILLGGFAACGGGSSGGGGAGSPGTHSGKYTIIVNGVVGSITRSAQVVLTVQ